ncbi:MAG: class I tRNA ligase family protein [Chloroflexota bacterium]
MNDSWRLSPKRYHTPELRYNTSIAVLMEFVNTLRAETCTHCDKVEALGLMLAPFAPHFAEENWERLGHEGSIRSDQRRLQERSGLEV